MEINAEYGWGRGKRMGMEEGITAQIAGSAETISLLVSWDQKLSVF